MCRIYKGYLFTVYVEAKKEKGVDIVLFVHWLICSGEGLALQRVIWFAWVQIGCGGYSLHGDTWSWSRRGVDGNVIPGDTGSRIVMC